MKIAAIGDNCLDVYLEQDHLTVGGNALNVAANCAIAGHDSTYAGPVGTDVAGEDIVGAMQANGVDTGHVFQLPGKSGVTLVRLIDRDRSFLFEEFGVCADWVPAVPDDLVADGPLDWIHVGGPRTMQADFAAIRPNARLVSADISTWQMPEDLVLDDVDVVFASSDALLGEPTVAAARAILDRGASEVVIMSGADGSTWVGPDGVHHCPAHPAERVDTCGAGDSYISGFMMARASGLGPVEAMEAGTTSATATIQHVGGFPQSPRPIPGWVFRDYGQYVD